MKIKSIKYVGFESTVDIEVNSKDHIFYGNGIATSNSHSIAYAKIGEWTAYTKWHFPLHFFTAYLTYAKEKIDPKQETRELVNDARQYGINVVGPQLEYIKDDPNGDMILRENEILFGLIDVKGIGRNHITKLFENINSKEKLIGKTVDKWDWNDVLMNLETNSTVMNNLILIGAMPGKESRKRKSYEYSVWEKLTPRDYLWLRANYTQYGSFGETLKKYATIERKNGGPSSDKKRMQIQELANSVIQPSFSVSDHPDWIISNEKELLGVPLSYSPTETKSITTNMTIIDFLNGKSGKVAFIAEINSPRESNVKTGPNVGQKMCFLTLKDSTACLDTCLFSNVYKEVSHCVYEGSVVVVTGDRDRKDPKKLFIKNMEQV